MGQGHSADSSVLPEAVDTVHMEIVRHTKVLTEINSLTYDDFKSCLDNLNALSRKCIDPSGKQLVFLVKRGTDTSLLWKATVKIACIKVNPNTRKIDSYKFLNLKQFLCVFKTFQSHLESLITSENRRNSAQSSPGEEESPRSSACNDMTASLLFDRVNALMGSGMQASILGNSPTTECQHQDHTDECSICLDRCTEVILPCTHSFCTPCIEQWNVNNKTCPICCEALASTDETWVLSDIPGVEEINDGIISEFMSLAKS